MDRIVTPFIPFKTSLESLIKEEKHKKIEDLEINEALIEKILNKNLKNPLIYWKEPKYKKIGFLAYLGKLNSPLRSEKPLPDLSNLLFLFNISNFLKNISEDFKWVIFYENRYFDIEIFGFDKWDMNKVKLTKFLLEKFEIDNIELIDLYEFFEKHCSDYFPEFEKQLKNIEVNLNDPQVMEAYYISYYSYPFDDLEEAINSYVKNDEKIRKWAIDVTKRYLAFLEARKRINFWKKVEEIEVDRATLSWKRDVISIDPRIGRLTFSHGVAFVQNVEISTEWFIDLLEYSLYRLKWRDITIGYSIKFLI